MDEELYAIAKYAKIICTKEGKCIVKFNVDDVGKFKQYKKIKLI